MTKEFFAHNSLPVPHELLKRLLSERIEVVEGIILFYWLILISQGKKSFENWARISDDRFKHIVKNDSQRRRYREWLEDHGYIKIRKWKCKDGVMRNRRIRGLECQQYRAFVPEEEQVEYTFEKSHISSLIEGGADVSSDPLCVSTRDNLELLRPKVTYSLPRQFTDKDARDWGAYARLSNGAFRVNRGAIVNRLYSTWVTASSNVRSMFTFCGENVGSLDLQAAQPTIVATLAKDDKMLQDCFDDELYDKIRNHLGLERQKAKRGFCAYVFYESPRTKFSSNRVAYEVQKLTRRLYPSASKFIEAGRPNLAKKLQDFEASIFVDGAFAELVHQNTPALTVHDSIYFPESKKSVVKEVLDRHIQQALGHDRFKIK
jgi:hypothetical protein